MSGRKTISLRLPRYRCGSNRRFLCRASVYCPEPPAPPKRVPIATTTPTPASPIRSRSDAASPHIGASRGHPRCSDEDDPRQRDHRRRTRAFEGIPAGFRPHGGVGGGGCARRAVHGGDVREPGNAGWTRGAAGHYQAVGCRRTKTGLSEVDAAPWCWDGNTESAGSGMSVRELAARNSFVLSLGRTMPRRGGRRVYCWGRAGASWFSSRPDSDRSGERGVHRLRGCRLGRARTSLLGVAITHSRQTQTFGQAVMERFRPHAFLRRAGGAAPAQTSNASPAPRMT